MQNPDKLVTIVIGERSNLSYNLSKRLNHAEVFSSSSLLQSLLPLAKYREKKVNIIFNNFQPSTHLNSFVDPSRYIDLSISLTIKVLMYLIEQGAIINKVIYTSSCSVYGDIIGAKDYAKTSPIGIPASFKYLNEQILREVCNNYDINLTVARIFNMFGGRDKFSVISKIIDCYKNKTQLNFNNDGKSVRDYIYIQDIVDVYEKLLLESSIRFDIVDIGSGQGKSLADILDYLSINGYIINIKTTTSKDIDFSQANVNRIQKIIDISSFVDVNTYLLNKLNRLNDKINH